MHRCTTILTLLIALSSCSSGPAININLVGIPEGTQVLRVNRALNGVMAMDPRIFTSFDPPKIRLRMAAGEVGSVRLMVDAMNETADRMRCILASGEGVVVVGTADTETTIELRLGRTGCEPIDPPPPDMSVPDLSRPAGDMTCVPNCRPDECDVSNGCGGVCKCAANLVCDSMAKKCTACIAGRTKDCDYCDPSSAFDKAANKGTQTCQGDGTWGECKLTRQPIVTHGGDALWAHECGAKNGLSWWMRGIGKDSFCILIQGNYDDTGSKRAGLTLPPGRYQLSIKGSASSDGPAKLYVGYGLRQNGSPIVKQTNSSYEFASAGSRSVLIVEPITVAELCYDMALFVDAIITASVSPTPLVSVQLDTISFEPL